MIADLPCDLRETVEAVWRIESARIIAVLARITRDPGIAEELAQDALVAAFEQWPTEGIPRNPAAWLLAADKHRAIDTLRRYQRIREKHEEISRDLAARQEMAVANLDSALDDDFGDDLLRLVFTACHPVSRPTWRLPSASSADSLPPKSPARF